jgi:hypothetical protein
VAMYARPGCAPGPGWASGFKNATQTPTSGKLILYRNFTALHRLKVRDFNALASQKIIWDYPSPKIDPMRMYDVGTNIIYASKCGASKCGAPK